MNAKPRWARFRKLIRWVVGGARSAYDGMPESVAPRSSAEAASTPLPPASGAATPSPPDLLLPSLAPIVISSDSGPPSTSVPLSESEPASALDLDAVPPTLDEATTRPLTKRSEIPQALRPGRWESGADVGLRRALQDAPHRRREFIVYVPAGWSREAKAPLIVLCHGCNQTPEEFAQGTRIAALADRHGWLVLMPRQAQWANPLRCWNWFGPSTMRGGGEAAIVAAMVRAVRRRYRADPQRVVAVGMSAGAALAAVLGMYFPKYVRSVVAHSGLACGAATSAVAAAEVMRRGPQTDVEAIGTQAAVGACAMLPVPLLAIHGASDNVIAPVNTIALVRQYLRFNGHPAATVEGDPPAELPIADSERIERTSDDRDVTTLEWRIDDHIVVRYVAIAGLGHAWSGGDETLQFNDARAPDASMLVSEFLREALPEYAGSDSSPGTKPIASTTT
jgi:poly(hydroxyalkanoate) depolymerase family esterase